MNNQKVLDSSPPTKIPVSEMAHLQCNDRALSLEGFHNLPHYLQATIITMACWLPEKLCFSPRILGHYVVELDPPAAKSLALVSKNFHAIVSRALYERLWIARPSTLRHLVTSIVSRPALGQLVRSIHLGPDEKPDLRWLPFDFNDRELVLSMSAPGDEGQYPSWLKPPHSIYFTGEDEDDGPPEAVEAIQKALLSACKLLDVELAQVGASHRGPMISKNEWYCRLFLVHAATELYVLKMPHYENQRDGQGRTAYPALHLTGPGVSTSVKAPRSKPHRPVVVFTTDDLRSRLATPDSATDSFEHPLLFAQSDAAWIALCANGEYRRGGDPRGTTPEDALEDHFSVIPYTKEPPVSSTATLKGILSLAGTLLSHTPLLRNLSLSGSLERVLCGGYTPGSLETLRSLSLGPPPLRWDWLNALHPDQKKLKNLQRLRVCGRVLRKDQALIAVGGSMSKLRMFQWSYTKPITDTKLDKDGQLLEIINLLTGREPIPPPKGSGKKRSQKRQKTQNDADEDDDRLFIDVRLHPHDVTTTLNMAPDEATRTAWREGTSPHPWSKCRRRFCVQDSCTVNDAKHSDSDSDSDFSDSEFDFKRVDDEYMEGRWWFDEGEG